VDVLHRTGSALFGLRSEWAYGRAPSGRVPTTSCRTGSASRRRRRSWTAARFRRGAGEGLRHLPVVLRAGDASEDALREKAGNPGQGICPCSLPTQATFFFYYRCELPGSFFHCLCHPASCSIVHAYFHPARVSRSRSSLAAARAASGSRLRSRRSDALAEREAPAEPRSFRASRPKTSASEATIHGKHCISLTVA